MLRVKFLRHALPPFLALTLGASEPTKNFDFTHRAVGLQGKLFKKMYYGPPGYGEDPKTDRKELFYLIKLNTPISVVADSTDRYNETTEHISVIQIFNLTKLDLSTFLGKSVAVSGRFHTALIGHEHTKVILDLDDITLGR